MKNHQSHPTSSKSFPEVNASASFPKVNASASFPKANVSNFWRCHGRFNSRNRDYHNHGLNKRVRSRTTI